MKKRVLDYARYAARFERAIVDLLNRALIDDLAGDRSEVGRQVSARRQGQDSSG